MNEKVIAHLQSNGFQRDSTMILGYSGGMDSMALAHLLVTNGYQVHLGIFDHQLRKESAKEVERAIIQAREWAVPIATESAPIREEASRLGISLEAAGRLFRYRFLFRIAENVGASAVLTAHHADDQVETVLLHLVRGTGVGGLGGMTVLEIQNQWHPHIPVVRPLLYVWRNEIKEYCQQNGLIPIEDASNADVGFSRNRLRHEVIPAMEKINPKAKESILRISEIAREDDVALNSMVDLSEFEWLAGEPKAKLEFFEERFLDASMAIRRRWLLREMRRFLPRLDVSFHHVESVLAWLDRPPTNEIMNFGFGLVGHRRDGVIALGVEGGQLVDPLGFPSIGTESLELSIPGNERLANGWDLRFELAGEIEANFLDRSRIDNNDEIYLSLKSLERRNVILRRYVPGERMKPFGMGGKSRKLSDIFIDAKVPVVARSSWPIVSCADDIIWIPGICTAEFGRLGEKREMAVRGVLVKPPAS